MTTKWFRIVGCFVVLALVVVGVHSLGYLVRPTDTDRTYERIKSFHELPENTMEAIVFGSSHAFLGINTLELYQKYGIGAYNYGTNWEKGNTVKLFLQDALRTQQSLKLAIIETYYAGQILEDTNINGEIFYTRYLNGGRARLEYLLQCFGADIERFVSYYMPLYAFHENWNTLTRESFIPLDDQLGPNSEETQTVLGFASYETTNQYSFPDFSKMKHMEITDSARGVLDDILKICEDHGVQVLFITIPYTMNYSYNSSMAEYAREKGCNYLNLFEHLDDMGFDAATDFKDKDHLNRSEATKVADYLGAYIAQHYSLTDVRGSDDPFWAQMRSIYPETDPQKLADFDGTTIYGRSTQHDSPAPDAPTAIVSVGEGGNLGLGVAGDNLLRNELIPTIIDGVTISKLGDGSITVKGTARSDFNYPIASLRALLPLNAYVGEEVVLSGCPEGGGMYSYRLNQFGLHASEGARSDIGDGAWFTLRDFSQDNAQVYIRLSKGVEYDQRFYPMLSFASGKDTPDYAPYEEHVVALPIAEPLRGIPVADGGNHVDADGQSWVCDTIDLEEGVLIRRVGRIELTQDMTYHLHERDECNQIGFHIDDAVRDEARHPVLCNRGRYSAQESKPGVVFTYSDYCRFGVPKTVDSTEAFLEWLTDHPTEIQYILNEPERIPLTADQLNALRVARETGTLMTVYDGD